MYKRQLQMQVIQWACKPLRLYTRECPVLNRGLLQRSLGWCPVVQTHTKRPVFAGCKISRPILFVPISPKRGRLGTVGSICLFALLYNKKRCDRQRFIRKLGLWFLLLVLLLLIKASKWIRALGSETKKSSSIQYEIS